MRIKVTFPIITTLFILGFIIFITLPSYSQPKILPMSRGEIAERVNAIIDREVQKTDLTGATIAVYYKGSPLITRGIGYADETNQIKVNEHTGFRIGSITKLFTAISIMKLVEDGILSLDDSIFKYLPDYRPKLLPGVNLDNRIRDLLTHHNGVPSVWLKDDYIETPSLGPLRRLPKDLSEDFLVVNRREVHSYSNPAYALAGLIVERASGQPYDDFIKEHFFETLGMDDSHAFLPENRKNIARPHTKHQSQASYEIYDIPAGSIITSASDMHSFMEMMIDTWHGDEDELIEDKTLKMMSEYQNIGVKYDATNWQGIGFKIKKKSGYTHLFHGGGVETFYSRFQITPELKIGVFISTNSIESRPFSRVTTDKIIDTFLGMETIQKNEKKQIKTLPQTMENDVAPSGKYITNYSEVITINHKNPAPFIITSDGKFSLERFEKNGWKIIGDSRCTLQKSHQHKGYYFNYGFYSENLMELKTYQSSQNWDRFLGRTYSTQNFSLGKLYVKLMYDTSEQFYYTSFSYPDDPRTDDYIQQIISDSLLQVQGKGQHASLVTQFLGEDTVKFCGLTFKLDETANTLQKNDSFNNQPSNNTKATHSLKSLFSPEKIR